MILTLYYPPYATLPCSTHPFRNQALVRLDQNLVLHVLENFITNAVMYGAMNGRVTLRAKRLAGR